MIQLSADLGKKWNQHPDHVHFAMRGKKIREDLAITQADEALDMRLSKLQVVTEELAESYVFVCSLKRTLRVELEVKLVICWCSSSRWKLIQAGGDADIRWASLPSWRSKIKAIRLEEGARPSRAGEENLVAAEWVRELRLNKRKAICLNDIE